MKLSYLWGVVVFAVSLSCTAADSVKLLSDARQGLEVYVNEVNRLFSSLPGWKDYVDVRSDDLEVSNGSLETTTVTAKEHAVRNIFHFLPGWKQRVGGSRDDPETSNRDFETTGWNDVEGTNGGDVMKSSDVIGATGDDLEMTSSGLGATNGDLEKTMWLQHDDSDEWHSGFETSDKGENSDLETKKANDDEDFWFTSTVPSVTTQHRKVLSPRLSFIVEGKPRTATTDRSDACLRDRNHVTAVFKQCIYNQLSTDHPDASTSAEGKTSTEKFLMHCKRVPQLRRCIKETIINRMEGCLDEGMRETIANVERVTESIAQFICKTEADRIALFIHDGGLECWRNLVSRAGVLLCLNANIASHVFNSLFDVPSLKVFTDRCLQLDFAERCVQQEIENCEDDVSALLVGVFFNVAKEVASCGMNTTQLPTTKQTTTTTTRATTTVSTVLPTSVTQEISPTVEKTSIKLLQTEVSVAVVICALIVIAMFGAIFLKRMVDKAEHKCTCTVVANTSNVENASS